MANIFSKNAYNILGLETNTSIKEVNRRAKEIIRLADIGNDKVDGDLGILNPDRSPSSINEALDKISSPKNQLKEYFFWFENNDSTDQKAIDFLKNGKIDDAIFLWKEKSEGEGIESLLKKKNLAILLTTRLLNGNKMYLEESLKLWKEVLDSDKYWKSFEKIYKLNNDNDIDPELIVCLREDTQKLLANAYFDANKIDNNIFIEFRKVFSAKGEEVEKTVSSPAINAASLAVENLEKMNVSKDGVLTGDEAKEVALAIKKIQEQFNKLVDFGLFEDSETKIIRDKAAEAIRNIVLDIHNNLGETEKAISLINVALTIAGTKPMEGKLKEDLSVLRDVLDQKVILAPIDGLVEKENYKEAIDLIEKNQLRFKKDKNLSTYLEDRLQSAVAIYAIKTSKAGWDAFNVKNWALAESNFLEARKIVDKYIDKYNFDKEGLDNYLSNINTRLSLVNANNISLIDTISEEVRKTSKEVFPDKWEGLIIISLVDSIIMPVGIKFIRKAQSASTFYTLGWLTIWFYGIGIIFFIIGWAIKNGK
jgi:hypothetical protein